MLKDCATKRSRWGVTWIVYSEKQTLSWPGLARPSTICQTDGMRGGWVYILTNKRNGILYTGVARDLARRVWQHREGLGGAFTRRYALKRLVVRIPRHDHGGHSA
jgi:hypothetical protein